MELRDVVIGIVPFAGWDESAQLGAVAVRSRNGGREWIAGNGSTLAVLEGADVDTEFSLVLSPRVIEAAEGLSDGSTDVEFSFVPEEHGAYIEVRAALGQARFSCPPRPFVDVDGILARAHHSNGPSATLAAGALHAAIRSVSQLPRGWDVEERGEPLCWLSIDTEAVRLRVEWADVDTVEAIAAAETVGSGRLAIAPRSLVDLVRRIGPDDHVTLVLPEHPSNPLILASESWRAVHYAVDTSEEAQRPAVEALLTRVFGTDVTHRDSDGDYPLAVTGTPVYARLASTDLLQIFSVVLTDVERSPDLLEELDDLNRGLSHARCFWASGQVLVEADLVASSTDARELIVAFERVRFVADGNGPALASRFGGSNPRFDAGAFDDLYLDAMIEVALAPGELSLIAGPGDVVAWPFGDETVHVITSWSPFGRQRPGEVEVDDLAELAADLVRHGASFVRAKGSSPDRSHSEPSLLLWGLDEETVVELGRRYQQDAVFSITKETVTVISCDGLRRRSAPRCRHPIDDAGSADEANAPNL